MLAKSTFPASALVQAEQALNNGGLVDSNDRAWDVLLIGGASGVGKTSVSYRVAQQFGVGITEVDDFQEVLTVLTTPEQYPALHFFPRHPAPHLLEAEEIFERGLGIGNELAPGLEAVVANHLSFGPPLVLEGDFIHPAFAAKTEFRGIEHRGRVRAVFIDEGDEEQIAANFLAREPEAGPHRRRAKVSALYAAWLREECTRAGVPVVLARPWDTVFERLLAAISYS